MEKEIYYGGQAIIEGVMMKSPTHYSMAVRKEDGTIEVVKERHFSFVDKFRFLKFPFVRGIIYLCEMLVLGLKSLTWSANMATGEEEEELSRKEIIGTIALSFVLSIGLFVGLPLLLTGFVTKDDGVFFNLIDGFFRLAIFIGYILAISLMADVKRLFQYHGAEHKTVNCYEKGKKLTVKNVMKCSTLHPRCGTSFIVIVIAISILAFSLIIDPRWWVKFGVRIIFIPVIAALSYEFLKLSGKYRGNRLVDFITAPGLWMQKLTTKEPDEKQVEVAIRALKKVLPDKQVVA